VSFSHDSLCVCVCLCALDSRKYSYLITGLAAEFTYNNTVKIPAK